MATSDDELTARCDAAEADAVASHNRYLSLESKYRELVEDVRRDRDRMRQEAEEARRQRDRMLAELQKHNDLVEGSIRQAELAGAQIDKVLSALGRPGTSLRTSMPEILRRVLDGEPFDSRALLANIPADLRAMIKAGYRIQATSVASDNAHKRHAADPKQTAKQAIHAMWEAWQSGRELHKSGAAFCREAIARYLAIENPKTVENWIARWRKQARRKRIP